MCVWHWQEHSYQYGTDHSVSSVFSGVSTSTIQSCSASHVYQTGAVQYQVECGTSTVSADGEAVFALALSGGGVLVVKLPPYGVQGTCCIPIILYRIFFQD